MRTARLAADRTVGWVDSEVLGMGCRWCGAGGAVGWGVLGGDCRVGRTGLGSIGWESRAGDTGGACRFGRIGRAWHVGNAGTDCRGDGARQLAQICRALGWVGRSGRPGRFGWVCRARWEEVGPSSRVARGGFVWSCGAVAGKWTVARCGRCRTDLARRAGWTGLSCGRRGVGLDRRGVPGGMGLSGGWRWSGLSSR